MRRTSDSRPPINGPWYSDQRAWAFIGFRYLPWLALLNIVWEVAQLPLYTIWREARPSEIAFAVVHCTLGDLLIGTSALLTALLVTRAAALTDWKWLRITAVVALVAVGYTLFSEWANTSVWTSWAYSKLMPTIEAGGVIIGLSPLLQWLLVPSLALYVARPRLR